VPLKPPDTVVVTFRLPEESLETLDQQAAALKVTRSILLRDIVQTWLKDDLKIRATEESAYVLKSIVRKVVNIAINDAYAKIPALIEEELAKSGED
jgi:metal-responsive CopG/Arc/MetJ family transcriptional regulator